MEGRAITLGNFDGVHLGHKALLEKTKAIAKEENIPSLVITYHPNPSLVLGKNPNFSYLQDLQDRKKEIIQMGLESVEVLEFNKNLANMEAEEFLEGILIHRFQAKHIVIGYNHCFGKNQRGNFDLLESLSSKYAFNVYSVEPVFSDGEKISSSLIRKHLRDGNLPDANKCLGRKFSLHGEVIQGNRIGRAIGSPTANIRIPENQVLPANGVYVTITNGMASVTNIGTKPTFNDNSFNLESHILDWSGNLYNTDVRVEFVEKLRNITKFSSPADLADQIQKDIKRSKIILSKI